LPYLKGRAFTDADRDGAREVAIVNDAFVKLHYRTMIPSASASAWAVNSSIVREIVGVVCDDQALRLKDKERTDVRAVPADADYGHDDGDQDDGTIRPACTGRRVARSRRRSRPARRDASLARTIALGRRSVATRPGDADGAARGNCARALPRSVCTASWRIRSLNAPRKSAFA
jgi:hypothetical protein